MRTQVSFTNISNCKDIVQCAFSLNDFEIEVYKGTLAHGPIRADDLADKMGRDRSTVYRALQRLLTCGMCYRETRSLRKGGYYHVYMSISKEELRKKLISCVEEWNMRMQKALSHFDEEI